MTWRGRAAQAQNAVWAQQMAWVHTLGPGERVACLILWCSYPKPLKPHPVPPSLEPFLPPPPPIPHTTLSLSTISLSLFLILQRIQEVPLLLSPNTASQFSSGNSPAFFLLISCSLPVKQLQRQSLFFFTSSSSKVLLVPQVEATSKVFGHLNFFRRLGLDRLGSAISCPGVLGLWN